MAIITISRKIASFGDETAKELANILNYDFIDRKSLEQDLLNRGISEAQLKKYDERKPGFWASLSRDRDAYFDYLREAVYEHASRGNCIFIGRGGFAILRNVPGLYSVRLVAADNIRIARIMDEFNWPEKKAKDLIEESDNNRDGFHKTFFNTENEDSSEYNMVINTGFIEPKTAAEIIKFGLEKTVSADEIILGEKRIKELLLAQKIVNHISFEIKLQIYFLEAEIDGEELTLHGVADNNAAIEKACAVAKEMSGNKKINSAITIVNEYKPFP
ncbi:cytidylate kinase family protein [Treponema pedis]|uniref:Cytidylate kinase family protein n=1 Tax=Treponema pedis TaxID=409322 RepID=A0A7S6WN54_9SPIR|nr:cytidylate kinase family protein [Treponema pedis]QOW60132.1 cytidylate kinase family protein [Treponema pedis]QSI05478.1 phospholipid-binding protein [Treponema pedis]